MKTEEDMYVCMYVCFEFDVIVRFVELENKTRLTFNKHF